MLKIVWSAHATQQLKERGISKRLAASALKNPDWTTQQTPSRLRAVRLLPRRGKRYALIVIFDQSRQKQEVVTAFLTSKFQKYL